eukprot:4276699-Karenia_brevis.AAC.1
MEMAKLEIAKLELGMQQKADDEFDEDMKTLIALREAGLAGKKLEDKMLKILKKRIDEKEEGEE